MRKFNFRESQTLDFQFWDKYGAVSYTEILYMIQSNRVENASNASLYDIFAHSSTLIDNVCIVQCSELNLLKGIHVLSPYIRGLLG